MSRAIALFDMGATRTRVTITTDGKEFEAPRSFETEHSAAGLERLVDAIMQAAAGRPLAAAVGGCPGHTDPATHTLVHAPNLPHWEGIAVGRELEQRLQVPVTLENDTALVGLGEAMHGAGRGHKIVMYETVSTGVNAVRIVGGEIDPAAVGFEAGAQLIATPDGRVTSLEATTGGAALQRQQGHPPRELASSGLWRSEARLLAHGLYNSIVHWSPEIVVFGGSMMHDIRVADITAELEKLPPVYKKWPPVVAAQLGDIGGLWGALVLANRP